jgi:hypothetical protein
MAYFTIRTEAFEFNFSDLARARAERIVKTDRVAEMRLDLTMIDDIAEYHPALSQNTNFVFKVNGLIAEKFKPFVMFSKNGVVADADFELVLAEIWEWWKSEDFDLNYLED